MNAEVSFHFFKAVFRLQIIFTGMVDGISEVIIPHVEGNHDQKGIAETNVFVPDSFPLKKVTHLPNGGVHLVFEKK